MARLMRGRETRLTSLTTSCVTHIESGEYPPGSLLPSEHQLSDEFQIARPTVVRALRVPRDDGWIESQQGKGSFVRGRPALAGLEAQRPGEGALNRDEAGEAGD
jgi:DNA-binding GntR family transcriptional regulator